MNCFRTGKRFAALFFSFILSLTILISLPAVAAEEDKDGLRLISNSRI